MNGMHLFPARRGCLHYGALSLAILFGVYGLALGIWGCSLGAGLWPETVGRTRQYTKADVLSAPAAFMEAVQNTRETEFQALKTIASFCSAVNRILIIILPLAVVSAATMPGPRHSISSNGKAPPDPRRPAWMGVAGMTATVLLFYAGSRVAPPAEPAPLPAMNGQELYNLTGTVLDRMETAVGAFLALAVATTIFFGVITLCSAHRVWRGVRDERRRRREESEALLVGQF